MQRIVVEVEDSQVGFVLNMLSNLKKSIVKNVEVEKKGEKIESNLMRFKELRESSNNKKKLTMKLATDTSEMVNDGLFWYKKLKNLSKTEIIIK